VDSIQGGQPVCPFQPAFLDDIALLVEQLDAARLFGRRIGVYHQQLLALDFEFQPARQRLQVCTNARVFFVGFFIQPGLIMIAGDGLAPRLQQQFDGRCDAVIVTGDIPRANDVVDFLALENIHRLPQWQRARVYVADEADGCCHEIVSIAGFIRGTV
jgi:hypothetical protein